MGSAQQDDRAVSTVTPADGPAPEPQSRLAPKIRRFSARYAVIAVWVAMIGVYAAAEPGLFFRVPTFQTIFSSQQPLVFMCMALLCTVCVGEFVDLSVPAVFGFAATILPVLVVNHHWGLWPASIVAFVGAVAVGAVNGFLVVKVGVNTIVVTLGMSTFLEGISLWMSDLNTVSGLPAGFSKIALTSVGGLPISFYFGVILVAGFAYLLAFTPLGRHMRFVGASREVSRLSGVRVEPDPVRLVRCRRRTVRDRRDYRGRRPGRLQPDHLGQLPAADLCRGIPRYRDHRARAIQSDRHLHRHLFPGDRHPGTPVAGPAGVGLAGLLRRCTRGGGDDLHAPAPADYVVRLPWLRAGLTVNQHGKKHEIIAARLIFLGLIPVK